MCGILGSVNAPFDESVLNLMAHRGPDDYGLERVQVETDEIQLGQRRLSIIDLSPAGHQPMYSDCGNFVIIFNGEIYNHRELKEKLPENISFKGHSDTETILYYLRTFGIEGVFDFNGIFAFAFLNIAEQQLFLVRDPFGVKPLYYHIGEQGQILFSSELAPIRKMLGNDHLDRDALASLLRLRYSPAPDTLYTEIKKVRPGHYLRIDLHSGRIGSHYFARGNGQPKKRYRSDRSLIEEYGWQLERAVHRQLLSDVEIGILLSGGIDSALVAALAQKHSDRKLKAFTVGFEGNYLEDEIADAAETAAILGLDHHFRKISFQDFLQIMETCTRIVEEPLATTSMIPMYYLAELAAQHVKVVLTGQGADEPLGGYTRYKSELIQQKIPVFLQQIIARAARGKTIRSERLKRGVGALGIKNDIDRFLAVYQVFTKAEIQALIAVPDLRSAECLEYFYSALDCRGKDHAVERMMALDTRLNLADDLLNYTDKITMRFSLECRVPMLDLELVQYIESLPLHKKLNLRGGKLIHKQFARQLLPARIVNRPKKAFQSPTKHWFKTGSGLVKELLLRPGTRFAELFNQDFVRQIIEQHESGYNREKQIFLLLSIYFWLEM